MEVKQTHVAAISNSSWGNLLNCPCRRASRKSHFFQREPLQSPLTPAAEIPQVFTSCQRGEQDKEGAGGPAAAGTRGKEGSLFFLPFKQSQPFFTFATEHIFVNIQTHYIIHFNPQMT